MKRFNILILIIVSTFYSQHIQGQQIFRNGNSLSDTEKTLTELLISSETSPENTKDQAENILKTLNDSQTDYKVVIYNIFSKCELYLGNLEEAVKWSEQALKLAQSRHFLEGELLKLSDICLCYSE